MINMKGKIDLVGNANFLQRKVNKHLLCKVQGVFKKWYKILGSYITPVKTIQKVYNILQTLCTYTYIIYLLVLGIFPSLFEEALE